MADLNQLLHNKLQKRADEDLFRVLTTRENLIDFTSNDYLGLARSPELFALIQKKTNSLPHRNGASGSRLLSGNTSYTEEVEKKLAGIFKAEAALIFNSGYAANQAVLSSIPQRGDTILYDELAHACIRDGARLSMAKHHSFAHNDLTDLEKKIQQATGSIFIVVESIYSMDGDECPAKEIVRLAKQYNAFIMIDEAHSTSVMGEKGSGLSVAENLHHDISIRVYTFGKAAGCHGACVVGSKTLIEYLINFARPFIFTTALSPHSIASIDCSFEYLDQNIHLQRGLNEKIQLFLSLKNQHSLKTIESKSQIQSVIIPGAENVKKAAGKLQAKGFDVRPILYPTVPKGTERLRICLHTFNSDDEIKNLIQELSSLQ